MESDSWSRLSAASRRHPSALQSRFDLLLGFEEIDVAEEDLKAEFLCPFCSEDFDIVGLCCHIDDEHPVEAKNGICPVCAARVGMDLVGHITMQHANYFKNNAVAVSHGAPTLNSLIRSYMQKRRKPRRGPPGSHSTLSILRKDLREGNLHSFFGGSPFPVSSSNTAPDPLLSSFISNLPAVDLSSDIQSEPLDERIVDSISLEEKEVERVEPSLPDEDQEEKARRSRFARGLVLSTIFEDSL